MTRTASLTAVALLASIGAGQAAPAQPLSQALSAQFGVRLYAPNQVLVQYRSESAPHVSVSAAQLDAEVVGRIPLGASEKKLTVLHIPGNVMAAVEHLRDDPNVLFAEPNWVIRSSATSNDPYYKNGVLWGMQGPLTTPGSPFGCQAGTAWKNGHVGSSSVIVAVLDTGIQTNHQDLSANMWSNAKERNDLRDNDNNGYRDDFRGWDFVNGNNSTYDGVADGHGTHVAGTIGAVGGNGKGVTGVCWKVKMISCKIIGPDGGTVAMAVQALDYVTDLKIRHKLRIVATNNSWECDGYSQALYDAISRANAANILFVASAGNGGADNIGDDLDQTPNYPACFDLPNIVSVAAIDKTGAMPTFSSFGAQSVDIAAPGVLIGSTYASTTTSIYAYMNGTSMATPHVTGAAALYAARFPTATAAQVKAAILNSADPTPALDGKVLTDGRLNVSGF